MYLLCPVSKYLYQVRILTDVNKGYSFLIEMLANDQVAGWEKLLSPAPMSIATMGQLIICASHIRHTWIDTENLDHSITNTENFRVLLLQIGNESYNAFDKAHRNMEKILFRFIQIPTEIEEIVKIIKSDNQSAKNKMLPRRLTNIINTAAEGERLSREVSDAFKKLIELIDKVLKETIVSIGLREQQIKNQIETEIEEEKRRKIEDQEKKLLEVERKGESNQYVDILKFCRNYIREAIGPCNLPQITALPLVIPVQVAKIGINYLMGNKINQLLEKNEREKEKILEEMKKIHEDYIRKLENMQIDVKKEIGRDETIKFLKQGMVHLSELKTNWDSMTRFFGNVENLVSEGTSKLLKDFAVDAEDADSSFLNLMADKILKAKQTSHLTYSIAEMYLKVSNRYIKNSVVSLLKMTALNDEELGAAQEELVRSCQEAANGILKMVEDDKARLFENSNKFRKQLEDEMEKNERE